MITYLLTLSVEKKVLFSKKSGKSLEFWIQKSVRTLWKERPKVSIVSKFLSELLKTNQDVALQNRPPSPYKGLAFLYSKTCIFVRFGLITFKLGNFPNFIVHFLAVSIVISLTGLYQNLKKNPSKGLFETSRTLTFLQFHRQEVIKNTHTSRKRKARTKENIQKLIVANCTLNVFPSSLKLARGQYLNHAYMQIFFSTCGVAYS